jgi:hypothetical protein
MTPILKLPVNQNAEAAFAQKKITLAPVLLLLFSRIVLFLAFQIVFFIIFLVMEMPSPWERSADWWPYSVTFTNIICVALIDRLLRRESKRFRDYFVFEKGKIIKSFLLMSGLLILCMPFAFLPNLALGNLLFGDYNVAVTMFYRPLPSIAAWIALFSFPLTMPFGELTVYFGYAMPRLEVITKSKWAATVIPALLLSFQHSALPLLFDTRFIIWRLFMFLPFAVFIALIIRWKPKLFPYILIGHFFIDIMNAVSVLMVSLSAG